MEDVYFTIFDGIPLYDFNIRCALHIKVQAADNFHYESKTLISAYFEPHV